MIGRKTTSNPQIRLQYNYNYNVAPLQDITVTNGSVNSTEKAYIRVTTPLLTKIQDFSRTPMKNFPGHIWSPRIKKKVALTIFSVVQCRKFSKKQNVDVICSEFR